MKLGIFIFDISVMRLKFRLTVADIILTVFIFRKSSICNFPQERSKTFCIQDRLEIMLYFSLMKYCIGIHLQKNIIKERFFNTQHCQRSNFFQRLETR